MLTLIHLESRGFRNRVNFVLVQLVVKVVRQLQSGGGRRVFALETLAAGP